MMKILWSHKFKYEESVKGMVSHYTWRQKHLPVQPTQKGIDLIVSPYPPYFNFRTKDSSGFMGETRT
jgi:hypothetical protein